nr:hypothetical protein [Tanacetum cinerariifolium]
MVLGIAPAAIIDRQLPFEYTITSRSTDVVVVRQMAQHVQNINHSAFRSMFEREKLSGNNFNDWFRQLKLVLRVEKKMFVIGQPLPVAPADSAANVLAEWNALYDAYNEVACLMLGCMTPELHRQFENYSPYEMLQELKSMFEKQVGTIGELHAMLIEYEKGLPKKSKTPQVMMIKGGKIQKSNKKSLKAKGKGKANGKGNDKQVYIPKPKNPKPAAKEHPAKDDTCHHCKEVGHWKRNCLVYLAELLKKKRQVGSASSSVMVFMKFDMHDLVPNVNSIYNVNIKRAKHNLDSTYLWHCRLAHISKKRIGKLQQEGLLKSTDNESFDQCVSCLSGKMTRKSFTHRPKRAIDLLGIIHTDVCGPLRHVSRQENQLGKTIKALRSDRCGEYISQDFKDYLKACGIFQQLTPPYTPQHNGVSERRNQSATRILNMVPTKKVDKTPYELWYGNVLNLSYLKVWGCEALVKRDTPDKL